MKRCDVCGNTTFHEECVDEVFKVDQQMVMIEHIPAMVCDRCGEKSFNRETVESVRHAVHDGNRVSRKIEMEVLEFV